MIASYSAIVGRKAHKLDNNFILLNVRKEGKLWKEHTWIRVKPIRNGEFIEGRHIQFTARERTYEHRTKTGLVHIRNIYDYKGLKNDN